MTDQDAAIDNLRRAATIRDDYAPLYVHMGRSLILQERPDEAAEAFTRAIEINPKLIRAHIGLAGVALERDEPREALRHLERALALGPRAEETYWQLAQAHRRLGDVASAEVLLQRVFDGIGDRVGSMGGELCVDADHNVDARSAPGVAGADAARSTIR